MNKTEYLLTLQKELSGLPQSDINECLTFYSEMIDDRTEEGFSEEEAISQIGTVDQIVAQTFADIPLSNIVKEKISNKKKLKAWEIILIVLGSPIWISLLIAFIAVILAIYVSLWSVILSFYATFVSVIACSLASILTGIGFTFGYGLTGIAIIGAGLILSGLSIFLFFLCKVITVGMVALTKNILIWTKKVL